jgi:hypothetical protein
MLKFEPLCLSTQSVIFLSLKLKRGLNALLPARVGLGALVFGTQSVFCFVAQNGCMSASSLWWPFSHAFNLWPLHCASDIALALPFFVYSVTCFQRFFEEEPVQVFLEARGYATVGQRWKSLLSIAESACAAVLLSFVLFVNCSGSWPQRRVAVGGKSHIRGVTV